MGKGQGDTACMEAMALSETEFMELSRMLEAQDAPLVSGTPFTEPELRAFCATVLDANNLQPGETLVLNLGQFEAQKAMIAELAAQAAERGIKVVEARTDTPGRQEALRQGIEETALFLQISSPFSPAGEVVDGKAGQDSGYDALFAAGKVRWCIAMWPTPQWAREVYPDLPDGEAYRALAQDLLKVTHALDEGGFSAHQERMSRIRDRINEDPPREIHMSSPSPSGSGCGTDLRMRMAEGQRFMITGWEVDGQWMQANIPSEEIWGTPDPTSVEGVFETSRPLMIAGEEIRNIQGRFEQGRLVEISCHDPDLPQDKRDLYSNYLRHVFITQPRLAAKASPEELQASPQLAAALGRDALGELGLVAHSSTVGQTGRVFKQNVVDENSGCHLGIGASYGNINIGENHEGNQGGSHHDLTIGTDQMRVVAVGESGAERDLIRDGEWYGEEDE